MMKTSLSILILFIALNSVFSQQKNDSINERDFIKEAIEKFYIKGLQSRDFDLIRAVCISETKLYGIRKDGCLNVTTLDQWSKNFNPDNPPFNTLE